jgi:hypothetical protein
MIRSPRALLMPRASLKELARPSSCSGRAIRRLTNDFQMQRRFAARLKAPLSDDFNEVLQILQVAHAMSPSIDTLSWG